MSGSVVFDTNTVIDLFKGRIDLVLFRRETAGKEQYLSSISRMELLSFPEITEDEENRITAFLSKREIIPIDAAIERFAIAFRRKTGRKLPDSIIAATAIILGATLVTSDKHLLKLSFPGLAVNSVNNE
jgi:predicted nucleic acid-binding protein